MEFFIYDKNIPLIFFDIKRNQHEEINLNVTDIDKIYFPQDSDIYDFNEHYYKKVQRKLFHNIKFLAFERLKLNIINKELKDHKIDLPKNWAENDTLRFLHSSEFDLTICINMLIEHSYFKCTLSKTLLELKLNENSNTSDILNSGFIYIHGRDTKFRPNIIVNTDIYYLLRRKYTYEDLLYSIFYFLEYTIRFVLIPGKVESWNILADVSKTCIKDIPRELIKMIRLLQKNYICRLNKAYIIGMTPILNFLWTMFKTVISAHTQEKFIFIKEEFYDDLFKIIKREQLEEKFRGYCKNIRSSLGYFPPHFTSNQKSTNIKNVNFKIHSEKKSTEDYFSNNSSNDEENEIEFQSELCDKNPKGKINSFLQTTGTKAYSALIHCDSNDSSKISINPFSSNNILNSPFEINNSPEKEKDIISHPRSICCSPNTNKSCIIY
jgi:hypothetical protein